MSVRMLVAYATHAGSTQEVANEIGETLRKQGIAVEIHPVRNVRDLGEYSAVVLGAPLYMFHWHRDAHHFIARFKKDLERLPLAIFAIGPFEDKPDHWQGAREQLDKELAKYTWLEPAAKEVFGGKFDAAALHFPYSWIPAMKAIPPSDLRNWDTIRAWAEQFARDSQPVGE